MKSLDKSICLNSGSNMREIAKPLEKFFNINYFGYVKSYQDDTHYSISTSPEWISCLYKNYHKNGVVNKKINCYKNSYDLWVQYSDQVTKQVMKNDFGFANGINIVKKHKDYCEFFGFATSPDNLSMSDWYLNNIDILENFILYFKDQAKELLLAADSDRILFPKNLQATHDDIYITPDTNEANKKFLDEIKIRKKTNYFLTQKEQECIRHLIKGCTMKEIAIFMNISPRTVETHLINIKNKTNSKTMAEIAAKLASIFI